MQLEHFQAFIFDLDGTLIDSEPWHLRAFAAAMRDLAGYEITEGDALEFRGNTSLWLAGELVRRHGLDADPKRIAARKFEVLYRDFRAELYPGAAAFVRAWSGRRPLAVASNSPRHFVEMALAQVGLLDCFGVVTTVDDVRQRKPDPEMIHLTLQRLGLGPSQVVVFEDSALGLTAARRAGCAVVLLDNGTLEDAGELAAGVPVSTWPSLPRPVGAFSAPAGAP